MRHLNHHRLLTIPFITGTGVVAAASAVGVMALASHASHSSTPAPAVAGAALATTTPATVHALALTRTTTPGAIPARSQGSFVTISGALAGSLTGLRVSCPSAPPAPPAAVDGLPPTGRGALSIQATGSLNGTAYTIEITPGVAGKVGFLVAPSHGPAGANSYWIGYGADGTFQPNVSAQVSATSDVGGQPSIHVEARLVC